jgi:hypothetical protein
MLGIIHCDRDGAPAFVFDMMEPERRKVDRASGLRRFAEIAVFDPVAHTSRTGTTSSPAPTADSAPSACRRAEEKKRGRKLRWCPPGVRNRRRPRLPGPFRQPASSKCPACREAPSRPGFSQEISGDGLVRWPRAAMPRE